MKKRSILFSIILMFLLCFCLCSCGNKLDGTWYYVCEDPENAIQNITFSSDGSFISDVTGTYVVEDETVRLNFGGLATVDYTIVDYEGSDALLEHGHESPEWCRDADAARKAYENR